MKAMKFPEIYKCKVDMRKIKFDTIKPWIEQKVTSLLGEDDVVCEYCIALFEDEVC